VPARPVPAEAVDGKAEGKAPAKREGKAADDE
jgi:hypothetical protein